MKKILIIIICGLFSLSVNANTSSRNDKMIACKTMATMSELIMSLRQSGLSHSEQLALKDSIYQGALKQNKKVAEGLRAYQSIMIKLAYNVPQYSDKEEQQQAILGFKTLFYIDCLERIQ